VGRQTLTRTAKARPTTQTVESAETLNRRCPTYPLRLLQSALFLDMRYSADTLGSTHGFPGFPDHPNRVSEGDTSKVWPRANSAPA
jgi:hypothetical protein